MEGHSWEQNQDSGEIQGCRAKTNMEGCTPE